jgi:hypothetical protein
MTLIVDDIYPNRKTVTKIFFFFFIIYEAWCGKHEPSNSKVNNKMNVLCYVIFGSECSLFLVLNVVFPQLCWSLDLSEGLFQ